MKNQGIVKETDIVICSIKLHEIEGNLNHIADNIISIKIDSKDLLEQLDARNELMTLMPR